MDLKKPRDRPVVSEKVTAMKKCETCYFCVDSKHVGGSSWCHCSNLARSQDTTAATSWVRSRLNLTCWQKPESV
ncbi:MAG: hypothetical protein ACXABH_11520 [Candidatus Thorarchaeota archaeon]